MEQTKIPKDWEEWLNLIDYYEWLGNDIYLSKWTGHEAFLYPEWSIDDLEIQYVTKATLHDYLMKLLANNRVTKSTVREILQKTPKGKKLKAKVFKEYKIVTLSEDHYERHNDVTEKIIDSLWRGKVQASGLRDDGVHRIIPYSDWKNRSLVLNFIESKFYELDGTSWELRVNPTQIERYIKKILTTSGKTGRPTFLHRKELEDYIQQINSKNPKGRYKLLYKEFKALIQTNLTTLKDNYPKEKNLFPSYSFFCENLRKSRG